MYISKHGNKWRIEGYQDGKKYRISIDHEPSQREASKLLREKASENKPMPINDMTFEDAIDSYCDMKSRVLSPSTISGYKSVKRNLPTRFLKTKLSEIDSVAIQKTINDYSLNRSPKSVANAYGLISTVMRMFYPKLEINVSLPLKIEKEPYVPTTEEVKRICEIAKGTKYWIPICLGAYGMRKSEICALTIDDLDGNLLHISKALVYSENNEWVLRNVTKTKSSTRIIEIAPEIADKIREQGYVFRGSPSALNQWLVRAEKKEGLPHFSFHKLRHYFATVMSTFLPEADWLRSGGWKTPYVAKAVYRKSQIDRDAELRKKASDSLFNLINTQ